MIDVIAFDADDTLWHSELYYARVQDQFVSLLAPYGLGREEVLAHLHEVEIANLTYFGYGIKGFTLSLVEAAVRLTRDRRAGRKSWPLFKWAGIW